MMSSSASMRWKAAAAAALATAGSGAERGMLIKVPMAGWENAKRWSGFSGGTDRQADRSRTAASSAESRNPKPETGGCSNIIQQKKGRPNQAGHELKSDRTANQALTTGTTGGSLKMLCAPGMGGCKVRKAPHFTLAQSL